LEWVYDNDNQITGVKWIKNSAGNILVLEKPLKDGAGQPV